MRSLAVAGLAVLLTSGCAAGPFTELPPGPPLAAACPNPVLVPSQDPHCVWETVVDVVDDYFRIEREEPTRLIGCTPTQGYLETFPEVGATIFEPWRGDSVDEYERVECTLQTIRRRAVVRVVPAPQGYSVEVAVFKELEDMLRPEHSDAGSATQTYDGSLTRVLNPEKQRKLTLGWIPLGRDPLLEQRILGQIQARFGGLG